MSGEKLSHKKFSKKEKKEYGLSRRVSKLGRAHYWYVSFNRRGYKISRTFFDGVYGGNKAAYKMAKSYRDEVLKIIPPYTNVEAATTLRKNNTSGVSGVNGGLRSTGVKTYAKHLHIH